MPNGFKKILPTSPFLVVLVANALIWRLWLGESEKPCCASGDGEGRGRLGFSTLDNGQKPHEASYHAWRQRGLETLNCLNAASRRRAQ
jgi:hypothetical protein